MPTCGRTLSTPPTTFKYLTITLASPLPPHQKQNEEMLSMSDSLTKLRSGDTIVDLERDLINLQGQVAMVDQVGGREGLPGEEGAIRTEMSLI